MSVDYIFILPVFHSVGLSLRLEEQQYLVCLYTYVIAITCHYYFSRQ